jgi:hypothetical protein
MVCGALISELLLEIQQSELSAACTLRDGDELCWIPLQTALDCSLVSSCVHDLHVCWLLALAAEMPSVHALSVRVEHAARCCNSWVATAAACESSAGMYLHVD